MSSKFDETFGGPEGMSKRGAADVACDPAEGLRRRIVQNLVASQGPAYTLALVRGYLASEDIAPEAPAAFGGFVRELEAMDVEPSGVHVIEQLALSSDESSLVDATERLSVPELPEAVLASVVEAGQRLRDANSASSALRKPRPLAPWRAALTVASQWRLRPVAPAWCGAVAAASILFLLNDDARLRARFDPMGAQPPTSMPLSALQGGVGESFFSRIAASLKMGDARSNAVDAEQPGDGPFELQVASFRSQAEADAYVNELRARGHRAHRELGRVPGRGVFHRVRIGPFASAVDARAYQGEFDRREGVTTLIIDRRTTPATASRSPGR